MEHKGAAAHARADQDRARAEQDASRTLLDRGAAALAPRPWRPAPVPPSAVDLVHDHLWRSDPARPDAAATRAALRLLPAARAEVEQLESALLFTARAAGLTWADMAEALGMNSPQACQQRYDRLTARRARDAG